MKILVQKTSNGFLVSPAESVSVDLTTLRVVEGSNDWSKLFGVVFSMLSDVPVQEVPLSQTAPDVPVGAPAAPELLAKPKRDSKGRFQLPALRAAKKKTAPKRKR